MSLLERMQKRIDAKQVPEHPILRKDIDVSVKDAYFGGIVLAALIDDSSIAKEEQAYIHNLGISLRLSEDKINETISIVKKLESVDEQEQYLNEVISSLREPDIAMFFLCEFAKILGAHEKLSKLDLEYLDAVGELLDIASPRRNFVSQYKEYLLPGKDDDSAQFIFALDITSDLPDGLLAYFTPVGYGAQATLQEQEAKHIAFLSYLLKLTKEELGKKFWSYDKNEIAERNQKRTFADKALVKQLSGVLGTREEIDNKKLLTEPETLATLAKTLHDIFNEEFTTCKVETAITKILDDIKNGTWQTEEARERDFIDFSSRMPSSFGFDECGFFYEDLSEDECRIEIAEKFCDFFSDDKCEKNFQKICARVAKAHNRHSADFLCVDSFFGEILFDLILLYGIFYSASNKKLKIKQKLVDDFPQERINEKSNSKLNDELKEWLEDTDWYLDFIEYKEDELEYGSVRYTTSVNWNPAKKMMIEHMKHPFDKIDKDYHEQAQQIHEHSKQYLSQMITFIQEMLTGNSEG